MLRVLVVDGDAESREELERIILDLGLRVSSAAGGEEALRMVAAGPPDLVVMDAALPQDGATRTLEALRATDPKLPVIMLITGGSPEQAIEAAKLGVYDCLLGPWERPELGQMIFQALEAGRLMRSPVELDQTAGDPSREALVGRSKAMQEIYKIIGRAAPTEATVLILGESGTGKELAARALYQHSPRVNGPFVVVNCVAIPETLLEAELFGYEKGAFTGAAGRRIGKAEQAQGGTMFLDEIGEMPLAIQAKLLRLLQERSIERLGGGRPISVDVRILAATNRDLAEEVAAGRFREDLYYRLNVVQLRLPPLRERPEDIPLLADYFLGRVTSQLGVRNPGIAPEAYELLKAHPWPGNVRELANAMEKCLILGRGRPIGPEEVQALVLSETDAAPPDDGSTDVRIRSWARQNLAMGRTNLLANLLDHVEKLVISEALSASRGNRTKTARLLGLSRPTLLARLDKYNLRDEA
jgi:DNA-binding NtrC family response regulator